MKFIMVRCKENLSQNFMEVVMRKLLVTSVLTLLAAVLFVLPVYANDIRVTVNGEAVAFAGQAPVNVGGRTLVPVRGVFEALGFDVDFDGGTQRVTLSSDEYIVNLYVGEADFTTNGTSHALDVPAQIISGSTMLPIRAVLESVGYYLDWDGSTSTVIVSSTPIVGQATQAPSTGDIPEYITIRGEQFSTTLTELNFSRGGLEIFDLTNEEIVPLRYMTNLVLLYMETSQVSDLTPLAGLINLRSLEVSNSEISDLTPLANLINLTELYLRVNAQISDLTPLAGLVNLEILWLAHSGRVSDITPLADLTNLRVLNLQNTGHGLNSSIDITPLAGLINLERFYMSYSGLRSFPLDLTPLAGLTNLTHVDLFRYQIDDWSPVAHVESVRGRP